MLVCRHSKGSTRNVRVKIFFLMPIPEKNFFSHKYKCGLMLSFPSQNDKKNFFPTGRVYSKKRTWATGNQHIFKSGLNTKFLWFGQKKIKQYYASELCLRSVDVKNIIAFIFLRCCYYLLLLRSFVCHYLNLVIMTYNCNSHTFSKHIYQNPEHYFSLKQLHRKQ